MWENSQRGKLTATVLKFSRLISGSIDEALHFLNELEQLEFGDIEVPENVVFPLTEANCNTIVTITNRRMYNDYKDKQNTRLRVKKHRDRKKIAQEKQECNTEVTGTSSSSSSSSELKKSKAFSLPSKEEINESSKPKLKDDIEQLSKKLYDEKIFPKVYSFKNKMLKDGKNERTILHVLSRCYLKRKFKEGPWAYCLKIIQIEDGNYNERDYLKTVP